LPQAQLRQAQQEERLRQAQKGPLVPWKCIAHDFNNILGAILGYTELTLHELS
jgi:hypothetical protein